MLAKTRWLGATNNDSLLWVATNKLMWWRRLHKPDVQVSTRLCGNSVRHAWPVILDLLGADAVVYTFGIGRDASFEQELIDTVGCKVYSFDPTPKSIAWLKGQNFGPNFHFGEIGISDADGTMELAPPLKEGHISYSAYLPTSTERPPLQVRACTLPTIMGELGHVRLDLLKMDIEGCEYRVIDHLEASGLRPPQMLIEFHQGFYGCSKQMTLESVTKVNRMGYEIFWVSDRGLEYGFVHKAALNRLARDG